MVSETLDIQVLVRAMYDYESEDATNLTFKKDDVIQVLAQLDSGWWAGHCQGRQGWFPSNYVQVLGDDDLDSQDEEDPEHEGEDLDVSSLFFPLTFTPPSLSTFVISFFSSTRQGKEATCPSNKTLVLCHCSLVLTQ